MFSRLKEMPLVLEKFCFINVLKVQFYDLFSFFFKLDNCFTMLLVSAVQQPESSSSMIFISLFPSPFVKKHKD